MGCCTEPDQGVYLKRSSVLHLQINLHNHFLLPTHSSQAALCAKAEKSANRGVQSTRGLSTGPYSSSPQCSSLILQYQPQNGFIFFIYFLIKIHKYCPLRGPEIIWMLIPPFQWCLKDKLSQYCHWVGEVKHARFKYLYDVCLAQSSLGSVSLHKKV